MMNRIKKSPLSRVHKRNSKKKPWNMNRNPARRMNWGCKSKLPFEIEANFSRFPNMNMGNCVRHENYVEQQNPNGNGNVYGVQGRCFHANHNGVYGNPKFGQGTDLGPYLQGEHMVGHRYGHGYENSSLPMSNSPFRRPNKGLNGDPQACHNDLNGNLCLNECNNNNNGFKHRRCHASPPFGSNKKKASMARNDGPGRHFRPGPQSGNDVRPRYHHQHPHPYRHQHPHPYRRRNGALSKHHKSLIHSSPTRDEEISLDHLDASTPTRDGEIMLHALPSPSPLRAPPAPHNTTSFILHHKWLSEMCLDMTPPVSPRSTTTTQKDDDWSIIDYTSVRQVLRQEKFEKELREAQENKIEHNKNELEHEPNVINEDDPSLNDNEEEDEEDCVSSPYDEHDQEDDLESIGDNIDQDQDFEEFESWS